MFKRCSQTEGKGSENRRFSEFAEKLITFSSMD